MLMLNKLKFYKTKGMTILEMVIYLSLSTVIIISTLIIMASMIKKSQEENKEAFRINKLYSTMNAIERYVKLGCTNRVYCENNILSFTTASGACTINQQGPDLMIKIKDTPMYFIHNECYKTEVDKFECSIKENLLYLNLKLKTGEMMKKCIHINR